VVATVDCETLQIRQEVDQFVATSIHQIGVTQDDVSNQVQVDMQWMDDVEVEIEQFGYAHLDDLKEG